MDVRFAMKQWWLRHTLTPKAGAESSDGKYVWLLGTWVPRDLAVRLADAYVERAGEGG
jgi:hypothetical protein